MAKSTIQLGKYEIFGFHRSCLLSEAINEQELVQNLERLIASCDDIDLLEIYAELLGCGDDRFNLLRTFRNITHVHLYDPLSEAQSYALDGIAYKRGITPYEHTSALKKKAQKALERYPEVEKLFREVFPLIEF